MATKSILKNVVIRDKNVCRSLVSALENAQNKRSKDVRLKKKCTDLKNPDEIRTIFGE